MSIRNLEQEIKRRLENAIRNIQLIDDEGNPIVPLVVTGVLPMDTVRGKPYILIQTTNIQDEENNGNVDISILYATIGASRKGENDPETKMEALSTGHWDLLSVIDKIREDFFKNTNFNFGILKRSMKHEVFGAVKTPYYLGETKCSFIIAVTQPQDEYL